ncbi:hypothetical protein ACFL5U_01795, partial [Candidatus Margulisiibacteriota bacterium]
MGTIYFGVEDPIARQSYPLGSVETATERPAAKPATNVAEATPVAVAPQASVTQENQAFSLTTLLFGNLEMEKALAKISVSPAACGSEVPPTNIGDELEKPGINVTPDGVELPPPLEITPPPVCVDCTEDPVQWLLPQVQVVVLEGDRLQDGSCPEPITIDISSRDMLTANKVTYFVATNMFLLPDNIPEHFPNRTAIAGALRTGIANGDISCQPGIMMLNYDAETGQFFSNLNQPGLTLSTNYFYVEDRRCTDAETAETEIDCDQIERADAIEQHLAGDTLQAVSAVCSDNPPIEDLFATAKV